MIAIRDYQRDVDDRAVARVVAGQRRGIIQGGTGSGKTACFGDLARRSYQKGNRVLVVAHQRRLVKQLYEMLSAGFGLPTGQIMAGETKGPSEPVIVASRDTFVAWLENGRDLLPFNLILPDECRLFTTKVYQQIAAAYPKAVVIGADATPARGDGSSLGSFFQWIECMVPDAQLVREGHLMPVEVYAPKELASRRRQGKRTRGLAGDPVAHWRRYADGLPTIAFAANRTEMIALYQRFADAGVAAEWIDGSISDDPLWPGGPSRRDAYYDRLASGETKVLCTVDLCIMGVDIPEATAGILWAKFGSLTEYRQAAGRLRRPCPRLNKAKAILLDHSGAAGEHGLPDEDVEWSLDMGSTVDERRQKAIDEGRSARTIYCGRCYLAYSGQMNCPQCGWIPAIWEQKRLGIAKDMQEARDEPLTLFGPEHATEVRADRQLRDWKATLGQGARRGWTLIQAATVFKQKHGVGVAEANLHPRPAPDSDDWHAKVADVYPGFAGRRAKA